MNPSSLKQNLAQGRVQLGAWLTSSSPLVAEAMCSLGFDWLAVDMEHGTASVDDAAAAFMAAERHGCPALVRLPSADPYLARRLLDAGAAGLIVPVVEKAQAFTDFARHCVYPAQGGRRGVGLSRANLWGDRFDGYSRDFQPVLVPQIETVAGVDNAAAIAALPQVDALFLGPYDLSASLGAAGDFTSPAFLAARDRVMAACREAGKAPGIHQVVTDPAQLQAQIDGGFRFVAYGTDLTALRFALSSFQTLSLDR